MTRIGRALAATAVATALSAGCTSTDCTAIGADPKVQLETEDGRAMPDGFAAQVCLADQCATQPWREGGQTTVGLPLPDGGAVELRVRTLDATGAVVDDDRVPVTVQAFSPNGPDCEPTVGLARLWRTADGAFRQVGSPDS